jgi:TetR/AcrR family transcriptional regulator, mexCD-oprJ operon repressor
VYAHFPTREALLEAVVTRAVRSAMGAITAAAPDDGPPLEALDRLVEAGWSEIERHEAIGRAVAEHLGSAAMARSHEAMHEPVAALIRRGQAEGAFGDELPIGWLVASFFALMHAYRDEVQAGRLSPEDAVPNLQATLRRVVQTGAGVAS